MNAGFWNRGVRIVQVRWVVSDIVNTHHDASLDIIGMSGVIKINEEFETNLVFMFPA